MRYENALSIQSSRQVQQICDTFSKNLAYNEKMLEIAKMRK